MQLWSRSISYLGHCEQSLTLNQAGIKQNETEEANQSKLLTENIQKPQQTNRTNSHTKLKTSFTNLFKPVTPEQAERMRTFTEMKHIETHQDPISLFEVKKYKDLQIK